MRGVTKSSAKMRFDKSVLRKAALALGSMVIGTFVGYGVQASLAVVGLGGPSVDTLIAEQQANFKNVDAKLDTLRRLSSSPEAKQTIAELNAALHHQEELSKRASEELRTLSQQNLANRDEQLVKSGMAGGADLWLRPGESINIGDRSQVFALKRAPRGYADVSVSGTPRRLAFGDKIQVQAGARSCSVYFKQGARRLDGRIGFDVNCG
jgi:hypothetical protein